uniref:Uncharacterized protein n=1 Tax=Ciona savignyi TaxID=51511 RepID=H2YM62_CIOSA
YFIQLSERDVLLRKLKKFGNIAEPTPKPNLKRKESSGCGIHKQVVGGSESSDTSKVFTEHKGWLLEKYSKEKVIHHKNQRTAPATPFIAVIGESPVSATEFYVAIEQEVTARFEDFFTALVYTFCSFYVFNMVYTEKIKNMLEFVQRYFAKIGECGSKTEKAKRHNVSPKVRLLCNAINQCMEDGTDCCSGICKNLCSWTF